ncbi:hypothetical protein ACHAWF_014971 [Thalassiosira exigua]
MNFIHSRNPSSPRSGSGNAGESIRNSRRRRSSGSLGGNAGHGSVTLGREASSPCSHVEGASSVHRRRAASYYNEDVTAPRTVKNSCKSNGSSIYSPDDDDDDGSSGSQTSQRARRRQLRELERQSDDCWQANLSDEEVDTLPLEWNSSMVRRQMLRQSGARNDGVEVISKTDNDMPPKANSAMTDSSETTNKPLAGNEPECMSLPEQLLEKRLRRKQRMHEKHEQFVRYQQRKHQEEEHDEASGHSSSIAKNSSYATPVKNSINHLAGNSEIPLFPEEDFDDDNASTVASSNGASNDYCSQLRPGNISNESTKTPTSPLRSLPQRPICPFPDESDRKRIVGCLAAVLASSYAYETAPHLLVKEKEAGKGVPTAENVLNRDSDAEELVLMRSDEAEVERDMAESIDTPDSGDTSDGNNSPPPHHLQKHKKQQHLIQQSRQSSPVRNVTAASQMSGANEFKNRSYSSGDIRGNQSAPASNPMASLHQSFSFAPFQNNSGYSAKDHLSHAARMFETPGSQNPPPFVAVELAEIRHRIRRHAILSELLVSSAEMLLLDPSHAKAFLPMLETLLTNSAMDKDGHDPDAGRRHSWKGRGFGGGGVDLPVFDEEDTATVPIQQSTNSSTIHCPPPTRTAQSEEVAPFPSNNISSDIAALNSASANPVSDRNDAYSQGPLDTPSPGDLYEPFSPSRTRTSSAEKQPSSSPNASSVTPSYAPLETAIIERDLVAPFLQTLTPGAGFKCIALLLLNHLLRDGRGYDARVRQAFKRLAVIVLSHELKVGGILRVDLDEEEGLDAMLWGDLRAHQNLPNKEEENDDADELAMLATRKFEAMESAIAAKLISMSGNGRSKEASGSESGNTQSIEPGRRSKKKQSRTKTTSTSASSPSSSTHGRIALAPKETPLSSQHGLSKEQLLRGLKVGTAGAVGATLFALTGGLAAPGIAAGLAAVAGTSAIAAGVSTVLSSAAAITTIFGVGGAGLASYKMHRRTKGLTEFNFHKELGRGKETKAELFSTVCISGWLRDARDFQRPWGVSPSHPRIIDKQELLERFYYIYNPQNVFRVPEILRHWKGRYFQLWRALREKYGRDPSNLFPLEEGPRISADLTHEEGEAVDFLLDELGFFPKKISRDCPNDSTGASARYPPKSSPPSEAKKLQSAQKQLKDSSLKPRKWLPESLAVNSSDIASSTLSLFSESETTSIPDNSTHTAGSVPNASNKGSKTADVGKKSPPKHLLTVWDYHANYGGELYTVSQHIKRLFDILKLIPWCHFVIAFAQVQWESELLMELCDSVTDQMIEWGISATKTILHTTVFATLMTAVTLPYSLVLAANAIDSSWTMAMERADRAGVELAKSLIDSAAGHRPVILAGYSMGARVIYSCLKELAKHQGEC